jgi:arginine N-succinyltransferase
MLTRFRAVQEQDLPALIQLAQQAELGVTTLPSKASLIQEKLTWALHSFHQPHPQQRAYFWFVLEHVDNHELLGVAAMASHIEHTSHRYVFKRIPYQKEYVPFNMIHHDEYLQLSTELNQCSELCTLFLHPKARGLGQGQFLSRARLLFLSQFSDLFHRVMIAEMRGVHQKNRPSPFWEAVGKKFIHKSYQSAEKLAAHQTTEFIEALFPTSPIYMSLLPKAAQKVVGEVHPLTQPAMHILLNEGFQISPYIDCFDAGPIIWAELNQILTLKHRQYYHALIQTQPVHAHACVLLSNTRIENFRATQATIAMDPHEPSRIIIHAATAQALEIQEGDLLQVVHERPFTTPFNENNPKDDE